MTALEKLFDGKLSPPRLPVSFYPPVSDRESWEKVIRTPEQKQVAEYVIRSAGILLETAVPVISFMDYTAFKRDGDRSRFQGVYFWRRNCLELLAFACALTGDVEKYLPGVLNYLWCILEERYWCIHAHAVYFADENPFPDDRKTRRRVDLFAAATGSNLALVLNLCGEEIRKRYPEFDRVIRSECRERLILPALDRTFDEYHWWLNGRNNWTTWIAHNMLLTGAGFAANQAEFQELLGCLLRANGLYLDRMSDDGYCDEGPDYWGVAGERLIMFLHDLDRICPGAWETASAIPKLRAVAEFPAKVAYNESFSVNFGDATARTTYSPHNLFRLARWVRSSLMEEFAKSKSAGYFRALTNFDVSIRSGKTPHAFNCGELLQELCPLFCDLPEEFRPADTFRPRETTLFPGRLGILRNSFFTATLKGGNNLENHNHNDLGHFTLFGNGLPLIVDLGSEVYSAKTFSADRYDSFFQGAQGHNGPAFAGILQQTGAEYTASLTLEKDTPGEKVLKTDLSCAYPAEAGLKSFVRTLTLTETECRICDCFTGGKFPAVITLFTPRPVKREENRLRIGEQILLDLSPFAGAAAEPFPTRDPHIIGSWGEHLTKIVLTAETAEYELLFRTEKEA